MKNILEYKGYYAKVEFSVEDKLLFGQIEDIADLITFNAKNADEIEASFQEAVDDYLAICVDIQKEPDKPYKGSFNVRISPELHRKAAKKAFMQGISLNEFVSRAIENSLSDKKEFSPSVININMSNYKIEKRANFGKSLEIAQKFKDTFNYRPITRGVYNA